MQLSAQQSEALAKIQEWFAAKQKQVFRLWGFAGTGKTTLVAQVGPTLAEKVLYAAYTGKAAHVLRQKGCGTAGTLHGLVYVPTQRSKEILVGLQKALAEEKDLSVRRQLELEIAAEQEMLRQPRFALNPQSELAEADLLVVDEVSMVGERLGRDVESFGRPILVLGDPAQLPPVKGGDYFTGQEPDFLLTQVHRQAEDSPVLQLATEIREGRKLRLGRYGQSAVVSKGELSLDEVMAHDQVIVGLNRSRHLLNQQVREKLGRPDEFPRRDDKLVCLRNNHEMGLLNGAQWSVLDAIPMDNDVVRLLVTDGGREVFVTAWAHHFGLPARVPPPYEARDHQEFAYGYAMTCHKAQGSQWNKVLVVDEGGAFGSDARRWLYTAVTRASESVTIVRRA